MAAAYIPPSHIESLSKSLEQVLVTQVSLQPLFDQYQVTSSELIVSHISQWLVPSLDTISGKQNIPECLEFLTGNVFDQCESTCVCLQPFLLENYSFGKQNVKTTSGEKLTLFFAQECNNPLFIFNCFRIPSEPSSSIVADEQHQSTGNHENAAVYTPASMTTQMTTKIYENRAEINALLSSRNCTVDMRVKLTELSHRLDIFALQQATAPTETQNDAVKSVAIKSTQFHLPN